MEKKMIQDLDEAFHKYGRDLTDFYSEYSEEIEVLEDALKRGYATWHEMGNLQDLYDAFNSKVLFDSNHNETIEDYLV